MSSRTMDSMDDDLANERVLRRWLADDDPGALSLPAMLTPAVIAAATTSRRRRRYAGVAAAAALVVAVASVPVALGLRSHPPVVSQRPAATAATPAAVPAVLDSLWGVDVTWLPLGLHPGEFHNASVPALAGGQESAYARAYPPDRPSPSDGLPASVLVDRTPGGTGLYPASRLAQMPTVAVRGHQGRLYVQRTIVGSSSAPVTVSSLIWRESRDLNLIVLGSYPRDVLLRIADGLVVHEPQAPADPEPAAASVQDAAVRAFTGGQPDPTVLGALVDGNALAPALERLRARYPQQVAQARLQKPATITFLSPTLAWVSATVLFPPTADGYNSSSVEGPALLVDGQWKLATQTYCSANAGKVACP